MASWLEEIEPATMDRIEEDVTRMLQCLMFAPKKIPSCAQADMVPPPKPTNRHLSQTHGSAAAQSSVKGVAADSW
jgi:hypothetical protein